jgi:hypothetical protein
MPLYDAIPMGDLTRQLHILMLMEWLTILLATQQQVIKFFRTDLKLGKYIH